LRGERAEDIPPAWDPESPAAVPTDRDMGLTCGMAFRLEDAISGNVLAVVAVGAAVLILPRLFPSLAPPLRTVIKSGLKLFVEAEGEAEGGLIDLLVGQTVDALLGTLDAPGTAEQRRHAARQTMRRFEAAARGRSRRWGHDHDDRVRRYERHLTHLRRALAQVEQQRPAAELEMIGEAVGVIAEDW
jgi:hypothetical protein